MKRRSSDLAPHTRPRHRLPSLRHSTAGALLLGLWLAPGANTAAQAPGPNAFAVVQQAVAAELDAQAHDKTPWSYRDHDVVPGKDGLYAVVETPRGDLRRLLVLNGSPLTGAAAAHEMDRLRGLVNSPEEQARQRKAAAADGAQAREFLGMLPTAFLWKITTQDPRNISLSFVPNPGFNPPDNESRVLSVLAGTMVVARDAHRIESIRGTLTSDIKFGFGLFGKIERGGSFNVERRELAPGKWQITETHVHISGHALLFKTIGQQEDEVKTDWHESTAPDLPTALAQLAALAPTS